MGTTPVRSYQKLLKKCNVKLKRLEGNFLNRITSSFELDLPLGLEDMAQHIEFIVPRIQAWSEDLWEENFYVGKRWKEIRDTDTYHEQVLHLFMPGGEYMVSLDGDVSKGGWRYLQESNTFIVEYGGKSQLFDLVFLNNDFFILKKHGDQIRKGKLMYYVYGNERSVGQLDWRNAMEELYNIYRKNSKFTIYILLFLIIIGGILFFTFA